MSIRMMSLVWEHSPAKGTALLLLLKLADFANDDGWCWPGIDRLAAACRRSRRQTQYLLAELVASGDLEVLVGRGSHHTNRYRVLTSATFHKEPTDAVGCMDAASCTGAVGCMGEAATDAAHCMGTTHASDCTGAAGITHAVDCTDAAGSAHVRSGLHPIHQEPSLEKERARASSLNVGDSEKAARLQRLQRLLSRLLLSSSEKSQREWMSLAIDYGRARTFDRQLACIAGTVRSARRDGAVIQYAEHAIVWAQRWADCNPTNEEVAS